MKKGWEGRERGGEEEGKEQWREGGRGKKKNFKFILPNFFFISKRKLKGQQDGSAGKGTCSQALLCKFNPKLPYGRQREHTPACCSPTATLYALSIQQASELRPRGSWGLWLAGRGGSGRRTSKPRSVGTTLSTLTVTLVFSFIIYPHLGRKEQQDTLRLPLAFNITVKVRHVIKGKAARSVLFPCTVPLLSLVLWSCSGSVCQDQAIIHYSMLSSLPGKLCVHAQGLHPA